MRNRPARALAVPRDSLAHGVKALQHRHALGHALNEVVLFINTLPVYLRGDRPQGLVIARRLLNGTLGSTGHGYANVFSACF